MIDLGESMPDYELLELLLTFALPRRDVKPLAKNLIAKFGSFAKVINAPQYQLEDVPGLSENSIALIKLFVAASKRISGQMLKNADVPVIANWDYLIDYCKTTMAYQDVEEFRVLFLDAKLKLIADSLLQRGTVDHVTIHPREVVKQVIEKKASAIILLHNHPTGSVEPSKADVQVTKQIQIALETMDVTLVDHIIIGADNVYSFKEHQIL
jgi:DNA repair protein RadC